MDKKSFLDKYSKHIKWGMIAIAAIIFMFMYEDPFSAETTVDVIGKISNCFAVPGVVLAGLGALTYFARIGAYDGISYVFSNFALHSIIPGANKEPPGSFYEYKQKKEAKGRTWCSQMFLVGVISLAISVVLLIVQYIEYVRLAS